MPAGHSVGDCYSLGSGWANRRESEEGNDSNRGHSTLVFDLCGAAVEMGDE